MRSEAYHWFVRGMGFAVGVALIAIIVLGLAMAARVVLLVFVALLLAWGLQPVVDWTRTRTRLGRGATVLLVYAAFFVLVVALAFLVIPGAINQFNDLGTRLAPLLADARGWAAQIEPRALSASLTALINTVENAIAPRAESPADPDAVIALGITVADFAISLGSVMAMIFFWLTERARLQRFVLALVPAERRQGVREAWNEIELGLGSWVRGQLILMGTIGAATTIAYALLGLEGALLLGVIAGLAEAIPLIGPLLGAIPALVVAAMTGQVETVVLVALVYAAIQTVESNVLVPVVMRNSIGIPPFLVVASILAGAAIGGIIGALLAVPIAASLLIVLERLQLRDASVPFDRPTVDGDALTPDPTAGEALAEEPAADGGKRATSTEQATG